MICANCIHYESCLSWIKHGSMLYNDFDYSVANCPYFKDKSDFKEVVRGKWIVSGNKITCPFCEDSTRLIGVDKYNYCHNCGARLKGE